MALSTVCRRLLPVAAGLLTLGLVFVLTSWATTPPQWGREAADDVTLFGRQPDAAAKRLQDQLHQAVVRSAPSFTIAPGDYHFGDTTLKLVKASNLTIEGKGATLWFGFGGGVFLLDCNGVTVQNLVIDFVPIYAQGRVVSISVEKNSFVADFDNEFLLPTTTKMRFTGYLKVAFWSPSNLTMLRNPANPGAVNVIAHEITPVKVATSYEYYDYYYHDYGSYQYYGDYSGKDDRVTARTAALSVSPVAHRHEDLTRFAVNLVGNPFSHLSSLQTVPPVGSLVTLIPRNGKHAMSMMRCGSMTISNVSIFGSTDMGVVETFGEGGNNYSKLMISRRPLPTGKQRLLGPNADGFHSTGNRYGPILTDSEVSFTGDDLGNILGFYQIVIKVFKPETCSDVEPNSWWWWYKTCAEQAAAGHCNEDYIRGAGLCAKTCGRCEAHGGKIAILEGHGGASLASFAPNSKVSFYALASNTPQGSLVAKSLAQSFDQELVELAKTTAETISKPPYSTKFQPSVFSMPQVYVVDFDEIVPAAVTALKTTAVVGSAQNVGSKVQRSSFHDGYARAFMIKSTGSRFIGNAFARAGGLHVGPEQYWLEGDPGASDVVIADNYGSEDGLPAISIIPSVAGGVTLRNNSFPVRAESLAFAAPRVQAPIIHDLVAAAKIVFA